MATSLRTRLIRSAALQVVLLGGALFAIAQFRMHHADELLSEQIIDQAEDHVEARLEGFFQPISRLLESARDWSEAGMLELDEPKAVNATLVPIMLQYPRISSLMVADDRGREHMILREKHQWRVRRTRRDEWGTEVEWWRWTDEEPTPTITYQSIDYDPRTRPWFTGALTCAQADGWQDDCGPVAWTAPYVFATTKDPGITASIARRDGERTRVIGFDLLLSDISTFTMGIQATARAKMFVITDKTWKVIGLPHDERFEDEAEMRSAIGVRVDALDVPPISHLVGHVEKHSKLHGKAPQRAFAYDSRGERWWGGIRSFDLSPGRRLWIGVTLPNSDLTGDIDALRPWIGGITLLVFLLAMWLARRNARSLSRPIEALVDASKRIEQGDLERGAAVPSRIKEIRVLADAQDRMREGVRTLLKVERDLAVAREIQQGTLPGALPALAGFDIAAASIPADETGGDTFDAVGLDADGGLTPEGTDSQSAVLVLADAAGHGVGPALAVTQMRAMIRMAVRMRSDFASTVTHINEQLRADLPAGRFVAAWFGLIDTAAQTLQTFSAGQAPMLHYVAADDRFEQVNADIYPLAMMAEMRVVLRAPLALGPNDVYLVLSDGYYEARAPDGEEFGVERVEAVMRTYRGQPASTLLAAIDADVARFTGGAPLEDDRTALVIRRTP